MIPLPYALSKLAIALLSPLGTALALMLLGGVLLGSARKRRGSARALFLVALAWLWFWSTPAISQHLMAQVESRYPPRLATELPAADVIVVLGGGMEPPSSADLYPDLAPAADRVWHAARVFKAGRAPWILASGGSDLGVSTEPEAASMRTFLLDLGVPSDCIQVEGASRTTQENAELSARLLKARNVRSILLVTSALHMRRAVAEFERTGLNVIPAATDYSRRRTGIQNWLPDAGALYDSGRTIKEIVGRWTAQFRPRTAVHP